MGPDPRPYISVNASIRFGPRYTNMNTDSEVIAWCSQVDEPIVVQSILGEGLTSLVTITTFVITVKKGA